MTRTPITSPHPWRGAALQDRPEAWTHILSAAEIADLRAAAQAAMGQGLAREAVTRSAFALPALASALTDWLEKLMHGHGFVLVRGLPVSAMSLDECAMAYWILGRHLGEAVSQNAMGETLVDIRDTGADPKDHTVRLYKTRAEQIFHTDGADIIGLLCLKTAKAGGVSRICSSVHVYNEILARAPALTPLLETNFHNHAHGQFGPNGPKTFEYPIVSRGDGVFRMLLLPWYIRNAAADFPEIAGLTAEKERLVDLLEQIPNEPGVALDMNFQPGDMQFLKNSVILHARTAYEDWPDPARKRHLLRLWLSARDFADGDERLRSGIPGGNKA
jgi:hypothetical protein